MSFENLVNEYKKKYIIEQPDMQNPAAPQVGAINDPAAAGGQPGMGATNPLPAAPKPLTTEGKRFMIELALKALAYNPDHIAEPEKDIFSNEVTPENAEEILEKIQRIVGEKINRSEEE